MIWHKFPIAVATLSTALCLEVFVVPGFSTTNQRQYTQPTIQQNTDHSWEISQIFRSPTNRGLPPAEAGAGSRGSSCVTYSKDPTSSDPKAVLNLTALVPKSNSPTEGELGLTVSDRPTFVGYIPKPNNVESGELLIFEKVSDRPDRLLIRQSFPLSDREGIVSINLSDNSQSLEVGKMYKWKLRIVCDPDDRSKDIVSNTVWLERIQPTPNLTNKLKNSTPINLSAVYAEAGIWHEAIGSLIKARQTQPNNSTLVTNWEQMLKSVGLERFLQIPIIN